MAFHPQNRGVLLRGFVASPSCNRVIRSLWFHGPPGNFPMKIVATFQPPSPIASPGSFSHHSTITDDSARTCVYAKVILAIADLADRNNSATKGT
jgi:hypothetical protein